MSEIKKRQVNKIESFIPTPKAKIIINALMASLTKTDIYNGVIEKYGEQFAGHFLSIEQYKKMLSEIEGLSKPKE